MVIVLNTRANNGNAMKKWSSIEKTLRQSAVMDKTDLTIRPLGNDIDRIVKSLCDKGHRRFIAAGGDGTVNSVANAILKLPQKNREKVVLGAIGLGSSNDFHKPMKKTNLVNTIPIRLNAAHTVSQNVGRVDYVTENGERNQRYFVVNASMGLLAEGNRYFNRGDWLIRRLKPVWVNGAINYTALRCLLSYQNQPVTIDVGEISHNLNLTNLSIVINPHFTGSYKYDTPVSPQSEYMCANSLQGIGPWQRFLTFYHIGRGRFTGLAGAQSWNIQSVRVVPSKPALIEVDGETFMVREASCHLERRAIQVCT